MADETDIKQPDPKSVPDSEDEAQDAGPDTDDPIADNQELQKAVYSLVLKLATEDRYARLVEVRECAHDRMYWRNLQYIWWSDTDKCFNNANQGNNGGLTAEY